LSFITGAAQGRLSGRERIRLAVNQAVALIYGDLGNVI
jgi:hypothetical protein